MITSNTFSMWKPEVSERSRGWKVTVSESIDDSSQRPSKLDMWQYSRAGARWRSLMISLQFTLPSAACVTLSQPMSIDVGGNEKSVRYMGLGFDCVINCGICDLFRTLSTRVVILLGSMEPAMHSNRSASSSR